MSDQIGITRGAAVAINDLLDNCCKIKPGQDVVLMAHIDGVYGGDNLVDPEAMAWIQAGIQARGANGSILWIDEPNRVHRWRLPPVVKAAMKAADCFIVNSFDITFEELVELKQFIFKEKVRMVRNFATTSALLNTAWARTPHELVSEIRYQALLPLKEGQHFVLTDENGTHVEGTINPPFNANHPWFTSYSMYREEGGAYLPWPEWVVTPIRLSGVNGTYIFDRMLSWWSRYIGISPYFSKPVKVMVENSRMTWIEGGEEADALKRFLAAMKEKLGEAVYDFNCLHFGVHPQAEVSQQECPNVVYRRMIEHSHASNIHAHIGAPPPTAEYPYWVHCTGDIRKATFKVGETLLHERGHLTTLDNPVVKQIAAKYPGRPGLAPEPRHF